MSEHDEPHPTTGDEPRASGDDEPRYWDRYVPVYEDRPEGYTGTCLRPLNKCEMGGCCDLCFYNPAHPRFHGKDDGDDPA